MELKFVAATRPAKANASVTRRQKLVRRIDQQIGYVRQMIDGETPRAAWAWMGETGSYYVPLKYGRQPIELKKGMLAVECPDLDHAEAAFCTLRAMVMTGVFDAQLEKAAATIRERLTKK